MYITQLPELKSLLPTFKILHNNTLLTSRYPSVSSSNSYVSFVQTFLPKVVATKVHKKAILLVSSNRCSYHSRYNQDYCIHNNKSITIKIRLESTQLTQQCTLSTSSLINKKYLANFEILPESWNIKQHSVLRSVLPASVISKMEEWFASSALLFASSMAIGLGIGTLLSKFNLPYIWGHKVDMTSSQHGGLVVADVLKQHGVKYIFTLVGGHISPILVAAENNGIRVVDTRHEVTAVFAADAVARMSGSVGVVAVTAGPGLTNTVTAIKNAQMAESPVLLIGGAAASILQGRGALQDIDQLSLFRPLCKYVSSVKTVRDIAPTLRKALKEAQSGTPGPVFVEFPIDVLYPYSMVSKEVVPPGPPPKSIKKKVVNWYLNNYVSNLFSGAWEPRDHSPLPIHIPTAPHSIVERCAELLQSSRKPVIVVGSQATLSPSSPQDVCRALECLGLPCFLGGMSRGLLGAKSPLQMRQKRGDCLKEADLIILAGAVCDFRLQYGKSLNPRAKIIAVNRNKEQLNKNSDMFWRPTVAVQGDVGTFLRDFSSVVTESPSRYSVDPEWLSKLAGRDKEKEDANVKMSCVPPPEHLNPVALFLELEKQLPDDAVLVADGGDFVGTASYILRPRGPLLWLDPGAFGTLGVGGGFALGAKLCRPESQVWIIYGDGACCYSVAEFDTFVRHGLPVIAVVGNDASWTQIAREQVPMFGTSVACDLAYTRYDLVAEGFGGRGLLMGAGDDMEERFREARRIHDTEGKPVLLNAFIGKTKFREGSISI